MGKPVEGLFLLAGLLLAPGCGGFVDAGPGGFRGPIDLPPLTVPATAGLWTGTVLDTNGGSHTALALSSGSDLRLLAPGDPSWTSGQGDASLDAQKVLSGTGTAYVRTGLVWPSTGTFSAPAAYTGAVVQDRFTVAMKVTGYTADFDLTRDAATYGRALSLANLAGTYTSEPSANSRGLGFRLVIQADGSVTGQGLTDATEQFSGVMYTERAGYNLFRVNLTLQKGGSINAYSGLGCFDEAAGQPANSRFTLALSAYQANALVARMQR